MTQPVSFVTYSLYKSRFDNLTQKPNIIILRNCIMDVFIDSCPLVPYQ